MLSKCANPDCSAAFHYYGEGKLYEVRFEDAMLREKAGRVPFDQEMKKPVKSFEHFWLCAKCADCMMVGIDRQNNVMILPRRKATPLSAGLFLSAAAS
jgi:hypothetical protein